MIVADIMSTRLITVEPDTRVGHAAGLLRHHRIHQLPVVRVPQESAGGGARSRPTPRRLWQGLVTDADIERVAALAQRDEQDQRQVSPWQELRVADVMEPSFFCVTRLTSLASAARLLVEQSLRCLPVIEPEQEAGEGENVRELLVGLLTRSDLLLAFARTLGEEEPGTQLVLALPAGQMAPLGRALLIADELHISVQALVVTPCDPLRPRTATLRLGTINPAPFFSHLAQEGLCFAPGDTLPETWHPRHPGTDESTRAFLTP